MGKAGLLFPEGGGCSESWPFLWASGASAFLQLPRWCAQLRDSLHSHCTCLDLGCKFPVSLHLRPQDVVGPLVVRRGVCGRSLQASRAMLLSICGFLPQKYISDGLFGWRGSSSPAVRPRSDRPNCRRSVGDLVAQKLEKHGSEPEPVSPHNGTTDWARVLQTSAFGFFFMGPAGDAWYKGLDRVVASHFLPHSKRFIAAKVLLDTVVFGPIYVAAFFTYTVLVRGGTLEDVRAKLSKDFLPTFAAECAFWPAIQAANFSMIPVRHQLNVVNAASVLDSVRPRCRMAAGAC